MNNKQIREERVRRYFIDSCIKLIRGEGVAVVNVRNVAEDAGYSSATLYNYFKDVYQLLNVCVVELIEEVKHFIEIASNDGREPKLIIKRKVKAYCNYFIQYPGIYELLFLGKRSVLGYNKDISELTDSILKSQIKTDFEELYENEELINDLLNMFNAMINGYLLMYVNKRIPEDYLEFMKIIDKSINNFILSKGI